MYFKLSIRNARRSFTDYLLYAVTVTVLLAVTETSNCISIAGRLAGFQTISLPLLIAVIQAVLIEQISAFMLRQRAKEFANYLLLGMKKRALTALFLCENILTGFVCFAAGTTIGFAVYTLFCVHLPLHEIAQMGFLYGQSMLYTFCCFGFTETVCSLRLKLRLQKLEIRELMQEQNRNQNVRNPHYYKKLSFSQLRVPLRKLETMGRNFQYHKKWGCLSIVCFVCLTGLVYGIAYLPENIIVYAVSVVAVPLIISAAAFYQWFFGYLYTYRRSKSVRLYQHNRLYMIACMTSDCHTAAATNTVFCLCFLFSAFSFITGIFMLSSDLRLFEKTAQRWMGTLQISICIVFLVIYFSILSLQQIIALRQSTRNNRILCYLGKSRRQAGILMKQQIALKLTLPMVMPLLVCFICIPPLNRKLNVLLPAALHNALLQYTGIFFLCTLLFCLCYFLILSAMGR